MAYGELAPILQMVNNRSLVQAEKERKYFQMAQGKNKKKDPILTAFAAVVRRRRHALSLTQEELAERAGFHVNYIGGIERAERNPSLTSLYAIAKRLELSIRDVFPDKC